MSCTSRYSMCLLGTSCRGLGQGVVREEARGRGRDCAGAKEALQEAAARVRGGQRDGRLHVVQEPGAAQGGISTNSATKLMLTMHVVTAALPVSAAEQLLGRAGGVATVSGSVGVAAAQQCVRARPPAFRGAGKAGRGAGPFSLHPVRCGAHRGASWVGRKQCLLARDIRAHSHLRLATKHHYLRTTLTT